MGSMLQDIELTPLQRNYLELLAQNNPQEELAAASGTPQRLVDKTMAEIRGKFGLKDFHDILRIAQKKGLVRTFPMVGQ